MFSTAWMRSAALVWLAYLALASSAGTASFDWRSISPSPVLEYHPCYELYQCARLLLPLDWLDETKEQNVTIALIKLPALVSNDDPSFGGTVFAQPGGPGQSGTQFCRNRGYMLRDLIDIPGRRYYEIVSFDPRGIGESTPQIECFPGVSGHMRAVELDVNGALDRNPEALAFRLAMAEADWQQCEMTHGSFLSYVGTPNVARDMLAMVDKIDEQRQHVDAPARLELRSTDELPRLQYFGISYGTLLGNYFASMFPGRVGRMVLDGVCDADDYANEQLWKYDGADVDEVVGNFFRGCFTAGKGCALYREEDSSESDIQTRFWAWADQLDMRPLLLMGDGGMRKFLRTGDIRSLFFTAIYDAVYQSKSLAEFLNDAMQNGTDLFRKYTDFVPIAPNSDICSESSRDPLILLDTQSAVICADGDDVTDRNQTYWKDFLQRQLSVSSIAGNFLTSVRIPCSAWQSRPNWIFKGPFETPEPSSLGGVSQDADRPAAPLLFMSNRYDPITPLRFAYAMAENHPGASVLVQESTGHCVIRGPMGSCVKKYVSEYFDSGAVPDKGVSCEGLRGPWD